MASVVKHKSGFQAPWKSAARFWRNHRTELETNSALKKLRL